MANDVEEKWLQALSKSGYRVTRNCRAIIAVILSSSQALDATEIFDRARSTNPEMGLVTVYRTLQKLEDLAIIQRVHQANGCHRFLPAAAGHKHLLICSSCGNYSLFSGDDLDQLIKTVSSESGFWITGHWLQFTGLCPQCLGKQNESK